MDLTKLGAIPWRHQPQPVIKATSSGITLLKETHYGKRYTGNKFSAVDINGGLWVRASELKKDLVYSVIRSRLRNSGGEWAVEQWEKAGRPMPGKKKPRVETPGAENKLNKCPQMQISTNLSTQDGALLTVNNDLSTPVQRWYTVNKREVRQRILAMLNTQRGAKELYFWTVSFFAATPDDLAYRMFNIWLTALRQYGMLHDYLWIAERQENGTIHFHIAIPHKMPVQRANAMMRGTLKTFAKRGELKESIYRCNRYNGVDIAKHRKTKRVTNFAIKKGARALAVYLTKYVTKNDTKFSHLAWHNSRGYSSLFTGVTFTIPEFINNGWPAMLNRAKRFDTEFFTFVPWASDPPRPLMAHLYDLNSYIQSLLN